MITRAQIRRQLRASGGIMNVTPRERFGIGSTFQKYKDKVIDRTRKIIPNELADIAVKAAPFVAPFNPGIAGLMRGIGRLDQRGNLMDAFKQGALTYGFGKAAGKLGGAEGGEGFLGSQKYSMEGFKEGPVGRMFQGGKKSTFIEDGETLEGLSSGTKANEGTGLIKTGTDFLSDKVPGFGKLDQIVQEKLLVGGISAAGTYLYEEFVKQEPPQDEGETYEQYMERRKENVGRKMRTYMDNYFANDPEYMALDDAGKDEFVSRYNVRDGGRIGYQTGGISMANTLQQNIASNRAQATGIQSMLNAARKKAGLPTVQPKAQPQIMVPMGPITISRMEEPEVMPRPGPAIDPNNPLLQLQNSMNVGGGLLNNFAPGIDPMGSRKENPTGPVQPLEGSGVGPRIPRLPPGLSGPINQGSGLNLGGGQLLNTGPRIPQPTIPQPLPEGLMALPDLNQGQMPLPDLNNRPGVPISGPMALPDLGGGVMPRPGPDGPISDLPIFNPRPDFGETIDGINEGELNPMPSPIPNPGFIEPPKSSPGFGDTIDGINEGDIISPELNPMPDRPITNLPGLQPIDQGPGRPTNPGFEGDPDLMPGAPIPMPDRPITNLPGAEPITNLPGAEPQPIDQMPMLPPGASIPPFQNIMGGFESFLKDSGAMNRPMTADVVSYKLPDGTVQQGSSTMRGIMDQYLESIGQPSTTSANSFGGGLQQTKPREPSLRAGTNTGGKFTDLQRPREPMMDPNFQNLSPQEQDAAMEKFRKGTEAYDNRFGSFADGRRIDPMQGRSSYRDILNAIQTDYPDIFKTLKGNETLAELDQKMLDEQQRRGAARGGRMGLMGGSMPMGIMRTNQAGVMERDYRNKGGFVPVGVKEKADDVPAMLSRNEFVMTADAVRGAGGGSIDKGAQKMYNTMKSLEGRVR